ncbi:inorganic phosphate transporter [Pseudokineococcus sp. 1T1Z-3]|uniref:inorganic phosphate transporter n=1 Tax=Pseudokineococcus sp. 1T1Z-3 TaxID=3132745 RepID=UPI00309575FE
METSTPGLVVVVVLALAFAVTNGVHGAAGVVATSVATRALRPRPAVLLAGGSVLVGGVVGGAFVSIGVPDVALVPPGDAGLQLLAAALAGATAWNVLTWRWGLPTSTTQALFGALAGAALVSAASSVRWDAVVDGVLLPALAVVVGAGLLSVVLLLAMLWLLRGAMPARTHRRLRTAQALAAAATAVGHGVVDAQRTAAVVVSGLVAAQGGATLGTGAGGAGAGVDGPPKWTVLVVAVALAAGTTTGGWRISRTVGESLVPLDAPQAFAAQTSAALALHSAAVVAGTPVSTSLAITSAVVAAGGTPAPSRVRWGVLRRVVLAWLLTPLAAGALAAGTYAALARLT